MVSVLLSTRRISSSRRFFFSFGSSTIFVITSLMSIIILSLTTTTTTTIHQQHSFLFVDSFSTSYQSLSSLSLSLSLSSQCTTLHRKHQLPKLRQQQHYHNQYQQQQQKQQRRRLATTTTSLFASIPLISDNAYDLEDDVRTSTAVLEKSPAFIIETLSKTPPSNDEIFQTISDMCIDVFFKVSL